MLLNSGSASGLLTVTKNCLSASLSADRERAGSEDSGARGAAAEMDADACGGQGTGFKMGRGSGTRVSDGRRVGKETSGFVRRAGQRQLVAG